MYAPTDLPCEKKLYVGCLSLRWHKIGPPADLLQLKKPRCLLAIQTVDSRLHWSGWHWIWCQAPDQPLSGGHSTKNSWLTHPKPGFFLVPAKRGFSETKTAEHSPSTKHFHPPVHRIHHEGWLFVERTYPANHRIIVAIIETSMTARQILLPVLVPTQFWESCFLGKPLKGQVLSDRFPTKQLRGPLGSVQAFWNWRSLLGANSSVAKRSK